MTVNSFSYPERAFQLWEFRVSHGSLLIRSPKGPEVPGNVDFICVGVEYVAAPRHLRGLEVQSATVEELQSLSRLLGKGVESQNVRVLVSQGRRFPVVAAGFRGSENDADIFESPFA